VPRCAEPGCLGPRAVNRLVIVADDLTGALDSAARFVPAYGPIGAFWSPGDMPDAGPSGAGPSGAGPSDMKSSGGEPSGGEPSDVGPSGVRAFDTGTRDLEPGMALRAITRFAPLLRRGGIAFKKIDSLLRGHVRLELLACLEGFDHCVLAPAFPYQGRITRGGRQWVRYAGQWKPLDVDLQGIDPRVQVHDAETQDDLAAIVEAGRRLPGRVLWCGTGGLAGALADGMAGALADRMAGALTDRMVGALTGDLPVPRPGLPSPILALIGSDHPVSVAQVAAVGSAHVRLGRAAMAVQPIAAVTVDLHPGTPRDLACRQITGAFHGLLHRISRPGTLIVAGGETLRALCDALGVHHLEVDGEIEPGAPTSVMRGGPWDGQRVLSKSGAFGDTGFLARLLNAGGAC
jgi:D-threonate/D-erythronate kinase